MVAASQGRDRPRSKEPEEGEERFNGKTNELLVAAEWFAKNYPGYRIVRASVGPKNRATKAAVAGASHALTYEKLASLVGDARTLLTVLCESQLSPTELVAQCSRELAKLLLMPIA